MSVRILQRIRQSVRAQTLVATPHAFAEMLQDDLFQDDVEHCLLTGRLVERQWDEDWLEWKYVIAGQALTGASLEVVVKLNARQHVVVITTYRL